MIDYNSLITFRSILSHWNMLDLTLEAASLHHAPECLGIEVWYQQLQTSKFERSVFVFQHLEQIFMFCYVTPSIGLYKPK